MSVMTDISTAAIAAREEAREASGRFGAQEHTAPELTIDVETPSDAFERGIDDARAGRMPNPGANIDDYMTGYEAEQLELELAAEGWPQ